MKSDPRAGDWVHEVTSARPTQALCSRPPAPGGPPSRGSSSELGSSSSHLASGPEAQLKAGSPSLRAYSCPDSSPHLPKDWATRASPFPSGACDLLVLIPSPQLIWNLPPPEGVASPEAQEPGSFPAPVPHVGSCGPVMCQPSAPSPPPHLATQEL